MPILVQNTIIEKTTPQNMTIKPRLSWLRMAFLFAAPCLCTAEILHDVFPYDDLKSIKQKYPNAQFNRVNAAWVTPDQAFFKMTGRGFSGELFLAFNDFRPMYKKYVAEKCTFDSTEESCQPQRTLAKEADDDALTINWVRWVPPSGLPLERYRSKYGEPSKFDFDKNTMEPTAYWIDADLTAKLSDDRKFVIYVETSFTRSEMRQAHLRRYGFVPDFLKEELPSSPPREKAKTQGGQTPKKMEK